MLIRNAWAFLRQLGVVTPQVTICGGLKRLNIVAQPLGPECRWPVVNVSLVVLLIISLCGDANTRPVFEANIS